MNDNRANEIRAALDEYESTLYLAFAHRGEKSKQYQTKNIVQKEAIQGNAIEWLRELLAERERMLKVMTEVADMGTLSVSERTFGRAAAKMCYMRDKLRAALDADGEREG